MITICIILFVLCIMSGMACPPMLAAAMFPGTIIAIWIANGFHF